MSGSWIEQLLSLSDDPESVREALAECPYRTFVYPGLLAGADFNICARHVGCAFAMYELEPQPISPDGMAEIQETLLAGKAVLILARSSDVRHHVRKQILAWYDSTALGAGAVQ
jgi:hypothetical protein